MPHKLKIVYAIPLYSQQSIGMYARFHDIIHTLQRMPDPPWNFTIVPFRRYMGEPSPQVLFQDGRSLYRLINHLRNIAKASRQADIVHIVEGQFPYSLFIQAIIPWHIPLVAGPNVALGINCELRQKYWGDLAKAYQKKIFSLGWNLYGRNKIVFHRTSPFSKRYKRVFMFKGYADFAVENGRLAANKMVTMLPGVRTDIFFPLGRRVQLSGSFTILYAGDACRKYIKDFDIFCAALRQLKQAGAPFHAYILGNDSKDANSLLAQHNIADRVTIVGKIERPDMPAWYRGVDVYVCSSRYEADCTTAVESLACGTPVIGTAVPGIEKTLSFPLNDAQALAQQLIHFYQNQAQYKSELRQNPQQWHIKRLIDQWHHVYQTICKM
ncbi:MAG: glycosyltransferase family 4 protein [Chloroflexi bacterium]|nr:glycosyltransferase family 4 protein [Chloroflexota bacterium]